MTVKPKTRTPAKRAVIVCPVSLLRIPVAVVDFYPARVYPNREQKGQQQ